MTALTALLSCCLLAAAARAQALPPSDCTVTAEHHLTCHLSSVNSRLERTDFSVIPATTLGLSVLCSQQDTGSLPPAAFSSLTSLRHLSLQGCVLDSLPASVFQGLSSLLSLQVSSLSPSPLRLAPGSLAHLPSLRSLDLSQSSVRSLPEAELCRLSSLTSLNISLSEVGSVHDLGVSPSLHTDCLPALHTLDISNNELSMVEADSLLSWPSLNTLDLSHNYIRFVSENVFANSSLLNTLRMGNNQMSHLPPSLLAGLPLRELQLANNSLSSLPSSLLAHHTDLELLDLSGNILTASGLPANLTAGLHNLLELDLCSNQLTELSSELTAPLQNLQVLKLCSNQLTNLNLSPAMGNLLDLDLSSNLLSSLAPASLAPFSQLAYLSLARNSLAQLPPSTFLHTPELLVLDLSHNQLSALPVALQHLTALQTLDISNNAVSEIHQDTIGHLASLWRLQLNGNKLEAISRATLATLASLQILDLSNNRLQQVEPGTFSNNARLRAVRLDSNRLTGIAGLFAGVSELTWLNVSDNNIQAFDYSEVPLTLSWLDLSHNSVARLDSHADLRASHISYLDASFNKLQRIDTTSFPPSVETLLLNDNKISEVSPYSFFHLSQLVKADLSVNEITSLAENSLRLSAETLLTPSFNLGGNPIACNCHMQWFQGINQGAGLARYPHIVDLESIYCQLMNTAAKTFIPLVEARPDQFLCQYQTHCFSLCQCCQFDSCDCEMTCPAGCACYHDNSWSKNIIQCSNSDYTGLPTGMPMDATEISLDGNDLTQLRSHSLIGRKNLRVLHLNNSNIERIENKTFNGLKSLRSLHMEDNRIHELKGFEFNGLTNLRELYLQGNLISSIHNATFAGLKSLEILNIAGNAIIDFPIWQLALNPYLVSLRAGANLWSCDCAFTQRFTAWMVAFSSRLSDIQEIECVSNEAAGPAATKMVEHKERVCVEPMVAVAKTQVQEELIENFLPLMIAVLASLSMLVIFGFVIFSFRHSIKIWLSAKNDDSRVLDSRLDSPKSTYSEASSTASDSRQGGEIFDAFVSYSPQDAMFVQQILGKELEAVCGYRVCLQHRDLPHLSCCSDTVGQVAEASRATILVLSSNYLATEWAELDYRSGLLPVLQNPQQPVLVVLLGSPEQALLYPGVRQLLAGRALLQWGDSQFWPRLQAALPRLARDQDSHYYSVCQFPPNMGQHLSQLISHI